MKQRRDKNIENNKDQILFVTKAKFPDHNAFATYIGAIGSIFNNNQDTVICVGNGESESMKLFDAYFGQYVSLRRNRCKTILSKIINQLFLEKRIFNFLKRNFVCPKHVFFSCEFSISFYKKVKKLFKNSDTNFSFIITEEYTRDEFEKFTLLSRKSMKINHYFVYDYISKSDTFIVISKYLYNKMNDRGLKCIYVPFSFNLSFISEHIKKPHPHQGINYIYCGNPENKDLLPTIIKAFSNFSQKMTENKVHLDVIGVDEKWVTKHHAGSFDSYHIRFLGRQNRDAIFKSYAKSDYSILLRDENKIFAKAGFPTKISESMILGVPPITNLTSNLSDYLSNENSIIVKGHEESDLLNALFYSVSDIASNQARKNAAHITAKANFDIEKYKDILLSLLCKED